MPVSLLKIRFKKRIKKLLKKGGSISILLLPVLMATVLLPAAAPDLSAISEAAALPPAYGVIAEAQPGGAAQEVTIKVDGQVVALDVKPVIRDGRTLIPLRGVFEKLGARVDWLPASGEAVITRNGHTVRVTPGSKTAVIDGRTVTMDADAEIVSGRTLAPLRFLSESMGARVIWLDGARTVEILDLDKLAPEQKQLLAAFDNLQNARGARQKTEYTSASIIMEVVSRMAVNNNDSHVWVELKLLGVDTPDSALTEPETMEFIKKGEQVYAKMGNGVWQVMDKNELDVPLTIAGDRDEQFLRYYNLPFKKQSGVEIDGQETTEYSFAIDQQEVADKIRDLRLSKPDGQPLADIFKDLAGGDGSKIIYLDSANRIIRDIASLNMNFQPSASDQDDGQDLPDYSNTISVDTSYDYTGQPELIMSPTGVFPGV